MQTQVKDLELKLKSALDNGFNQNSEDRFFEVEFQVPFEDLRRYMGSSRGIIDSVPITAKVDLVTKSITGIQMENLTVRNRHVLAKKARAFFKW